MDDARFDSPEHSTYSIKEVWGFFFKETMDNYLEKSLTVTEHITKDGLDS